MSLPYLLGGLLAFGAGWLLLRPALAAMLSGLPPRTRGLVQAGLLGAFGLLLIALRLAPFGIMLMILAGGSAARTLTRDRAQPGLDDAPHRPSGPMSKAEALRVLGLARGADAAAIEAAHKRMIVRAHPDAGGSDYLAAKVNEAREVLRR